MTDTPRAGRPFRQAVLGDLDALADTLGEHNDQAAGRHAGLVRQVAELAEQLAEARDDVGAAYRGLVVTRRAVVNLRSGTALSGVIVSHDGPLLEVADVVLLADAGQALPEPRPIDGRTVVERTAVDFIQIL